MTFALSRTESTLTWFNHINYQFWKSRKKQFRTLKIGAETRVPASLGDAAYVRQVAVVKQ